MGQATEWGGMDYGTESRALRACLSDWLTGCGSSELLDGEVGGFVADLFDSSEGLSRLALECGEDGQPIESGALRCDRVTATRVIGEIVDEIRKGVL